MAFPKPDRFTAAPDSFGIARMQDNPSRNIGRDEGKPAGEDSFCTHDASYDYEDED